MNNIINSYLPNCLHRKNNHNQLINTLKECLENIQSQKKKKYKLWKNCQVQFIASLCVP